MTDSFEYEGVLRAAKFRVDFSEYFDEAGDDHSFLIPVPRFDTFVLSLSDYPITDMAGAPFIPTKDSPAYPKHVHFRNKVRTNINRFSTIGAHIQDPDSDHPLGKGHPPFRIDVCYKDMGRYEKGKNKGEKRPRKIDKLNYIVQLKEGIARVLHRETAESMARFMRTKHKYTEQIEDYLQSYLKPGTEAYLRFFVGKHSFEHHISFITAMINDMMTQRDVLYKQLAGQLGNLIPPPVDPNLLPSPKEDE